MQPLDLLQLGVQVWDGLIGLTHDERSGVAVSSTFTVSHWSSGSGSNVFSVGAIGRTPLSTV